MPHVSTDVLHDCTSVYIDIIFEAFAKQALIPLLSKSLGTPLNKREYVYHSHGLEFDSVDI